GDIAIHAYAILDHEVCLLATPSDGAALGRFMQHVGRRFVAVFNLRHARHGALWADRFQSTVLEAQPHALAAIRFVEQAPVRAGLVTKAQDWAWSSAVHHAGLQRSSLVTEHHVFWQLGNTPFEREARHATQLHELLEPAQVAEFESAARGGWPLGSTAFIATLARHTDRPLLRQPRGRPRRSESAEAGLDTVPVNASKLQRTE
ncbi:MAG: transposase, partial [Burkholderiaceae bacterium]